MQCAQPTLVQGAMILNLLSLGNIFGIAFLGQTLLLQARFKILQVLYTQALTRQIFGVVLKLKTHRQGFISRPNYILLHCVFLSLVHVLDFQFGVVQKLKLVPICESLLETKLGSGW